MVNRPLFLIVFLSFFVLPITLSAQVDPDPEIIPPKNIKVKAKVGGLVPGPLEPAPAAPPDDEENKKEESSPTLTLSLVGADGNNIFSQVPPAFKGKSNERKGIITLQFSKSNFSYSASTRVDDNKEWYWQAEASFPEGEYTAIVKLLDPTSFKELSREEIIFTQSESNPVTVTNLITPLGEGQEATDIVVTPVSGYERVQPGDDFKVRIHLFGFREQRNINLEYTILGPDGDIYLQQREAVENRTSESFVKTFFTKIDITPGKYILLVRAVANNQVAIASVTFYLTEKDQRGPLYSGEENDEKPGLIARIRESLHTVQVAVTGFFRSLFAQAARIFAYRQ